MARDFDIDDAESRQRQRRPDLYSPSTLGEAGVGGFPKIAGDFFSRLLRYLHNAMVPVPESAIKAMMKRADIVRDRIRPKLSKEGYSLTFRYQGSAINGTLVELHSDVDILSISEHVVVVEMGTSIPANRQYQGNIAEDLLRLRERISSLMQSEFLDADVDLKPHSKAISMQGGPVGRKIDVVPAVWFDSADFLRTKQEADRGVCVIDPKTGSIIQNKPFLHAHKIQQKDEHSSGNFRPLVRVLKNLVADLGIKGVSSYDLVALAHEVPHKRLTAQGTNPVGLLVEFFHTATELAQDPNRCRTLRDLANTRPIFKYDPGDKASLTTSAFQLFLEPLRKLVDFLRQNLARAGNLYSLRPQPRLWDIKAASACLCISGLFLSGLK